MLSHDAQLSEGFLASDHNDRSTDSGDIVYLRHLPHHDWWSFTTCRLSNGEDEEGDIARQSTRSVSPVEETVADPHSSTIYSDSFRWSQQTLNYAVDCPRAPLINPRLTHGPYLPHGSETDLWWSQQTLPLTAPSPTTGTFSNQPWSTSSPYGLDRWLPTARPPPYMPISRKPVPSRLQDISTDLSKDETNTVNFLDSSDPIDPKNFTTWRKRGILLSICLITLLSPLSSSIPAPAMGSIAEDLGITSKIERELCISTYILGFAFGPLLLGPLSEVYGRVMVLQLSMLFYLICNTACGFAGNGPTLIVLRLLSGIGGSSPLVVGTGVISDCWPPAERGKVVSVWGLGPLLGPALGPLIGAFIVSSTSWRWIFWTTSIADAVIQFATIFLLPETFAVTILQRKMNALRKYTGDPSLKLPADMDKRPSQSLQIALVRPIRLLATQPIVQLIATYMSYIFGLFYLILTSFPTVWQEIYHESLSISGLNYLSLGVGYIVGAQLNGYFNDTICRRLRENNDGKHLPEFRIPLIFVGSVLMPVGLFWYGWTARANIHWIVPNLGIAVFAAGSVFCLQCMQTYIIDCYTRFAASAIAAAVVLRSIAGFAFPLFSPKLYDTLGYGWGTSVLGFAGIAIGILAPVVFWRYGARLRAISQYAAG